MRRTGGECSRAAAVAYPRPSRLCRLENGLLMSNAAERHSHHHHQNDSVSIADSASSTTATASNTVGEGSIYHPSERPLWVRGLLWIGQGFIALTLLSTLYYKFTYAPVTQAIFSEIGGRPAATLVGLMELTIAILLFSPRLASLAALLALGNMAGALATHAFVIGIAVTNPETGQTDGGDLFMRALGLFIISAIVLWVRRGELPLVGARLVCPHRHGHRQHGPDRAPETDAR